MPRFPGGIDAHLADGAERRLTFDRSARRIVGRAARIRHDDDVARGIAARRNGVPNTRGSPYDPSARPLEGQAPWRIVGKMGIDATVKSRHDPADFERAWPRNWGKVKLSDYL